MSRPLYKRIYHKVIKPMLNFITLSNMRHRCRENKFKKDIKKLAKILNEKSKKNKKSCCLCIAF